MKKYLLAATLLASIASANPALANAAPTDLSAVVARLDRLEAENAQLRAEVAQLKGQQQAQQTQQAQQAQPAQVAAAPQQPVQPVSVPTVAHQDSAENNSGVGISPDYSVTLMDHTENVNTRRLVQLDARANGDLPNVLTISGEVIAIADAHWSNRANKFGYLMRHPTGNNQRTTATQELTINSVQLGFTVAPPGDFTGYFELLYDPEQSFGAGTLTALTRNQIQVRKAYILWGNTQKTPLYAALGKMDVPFGLQDSVSPFTNSTNWHAFAPLAYGGEIGYYRNGLSLRAMAVGGGAQFRGANTPVDGTAIPSKVNNFAVDASYRFGFGEGNTLMLGASYLHGSAYCQPYPVVHFGACSTNVPAIAAYGRLKLGQLEVLGDYATTTEVWPGTQVPIPTNPLSVFAASKVSAFTLGSRYTIGGGHSSTRLSIEYSKLIAGADGSPWHRQDQTVLGLEHNVSSNVSLFGELIKVEGFVPLNFLSGGNFPDGSTWSEQDAHSRVIMTGIRLGF